MFSLVIQEAHEMLREIWCFTYSQTLSRCLFSVIANHTIPKALYKSSLLFFVFCVLLNEFDFQPLFAASPAKTQSVYFLFLLFQYCWESMVPLRWHSQTFKINFEIKYTYLRLFLLCLKIITTFSLLLFFPAKLSHI